MEPAILQARRRVLFQVMTFELDLVEQFRERVLDSMLAERAPAQSAPARLYHRAGFVVQLSRWYVSLLSQLPR